MGDYTGTETSATHTPDHLFAPGSYTLAVWNPAEGITVNGTTATIAAATGTRAGTDTFVNNAPGWFFTYTEQVTIEKDRDYPLTAAMKQQVRELTLVVKPTGDAAGRITEIVAHLTGAARTLDFATSKKTKAKKSGDKDSSAVPQPSHENNTAFTISSANFLSNPGGQSGYAYYMHLDQPQDAYRMVITIRTSGGKGYIRANTTGDPTQGKQVAEFTFAEGGTTEVKFTKAVKTQDLLLWVPSDSLPQNQLYIEKVEVF